jgi:hypothetical protein
MRLVREAIERGEISAPLPTHTGDEIAEIHVPWDNRNWRNGPRVTWMGIVKARNYHDVIEDIHSRTGEEIEDILKVLKAPNLVKSCVLESFDHTQEDCYIRVNRFAFPKFRRMLESIEVGHDVVVARGRKSPGFGSSIQVEELYVIDPD